MAEWKIEGNALTIIQRGGPGCLFIGVGILGIVLFACGCLGLLYNLYPKPEQFFFVVFFFALTMISFVMIMAGFRSPVRDLTETVIIDKSRKKISFVSNRAGYYPFEIPFYDISHIHTIKERRMESGSSSSSGRSSYWVLQIFFIKKDGAVLWVTQFRNDAGGFKELAGIIAEFTGFGVSGELRVPAKESHESDGFGFAASAPSQGKFVKMSFGNGGYTFALKKQKLKLPEVLTMFAALSTFIAIPGTIGYNLYSNSDAAARIAGIVFISIFYFILLLILMAMSKECRVFLNSSGVEINLHFHVFRFLNTRSIISKEHIRHIRVNRIEEGHYSLSMGISPEAAFKNPAFPFLANLSVLRRGFTQIKYAEKEKSISLWEIPGWMKPGEGATVHDLLYLEKLFQDTLMLKEKPIVQSAE